MRFEKPALTLDEQVALLQSRGLVIDDASKARQYLANIGYYRLSAYGVPFEAPAPPSGARSHQFRAGTTFDHVLGLYIFDRKLRLLVMEALERVDVAVPHVRRHARDLVPPGPQAHNLYNYLVLLGLMMRKMNPSGSWCRRVAALIRAELDPSRVPAMGFPADWPSRPLWAEGEAA